MNLSINQALVLAKFDNRMVEVQQEFLGKEVTPETVDELLDSVSAALEESIGEVQFPNPKVGVGAIASGGNIQLVWITKWGQFDNLYEALFDREDE
jgi:hypothetical protein